MNIKHLQLNTSTLRNPGKIIQFIKARDIDFACLQEICYPIGSTNPLELELPENLSYVEGIHYYYIPKNQVIGTGIISKYPVVDSICIYYNSKNYQPKHITDKDEFSGTIINDIPSENLVGSRGLKHSIKSRCILSIIVQLPDGKFMRIITTHFNVSDLCTETIQMFEISQIINSLVSNSKDIPTIFSGDLNIRAESYSVMNIEKVLTCHTKNLSDTLSKDHIAKKKDFPNGLAIDHTFSKSLKHISTEAVEIDFSEHKAVVSEFEI